MVGKSKEDGRIEKMIRGLLKLPENRRCINCNSLGPQYVCTTFWTFVCTNCSGVHREFTHRVKSVSMAKFCAEEVNALQEGGNERARKIYFKTWDPLRNVFPDSSNIHRLRDFIKHVYEDRRYTGESPPDKLPRLKLQMNKDEYYERRGADTLSQRCGYRGRNEERSGSRYLYDDVRSPGYIKEHSGSGSSGSRKGGPSRFDAVIDRSRDYDPAILRRSATQMFTTADILPGRGSPARPQHSRGVSSPPVVRPMREILGENAPALWVGEEENQVKSMHRCATDASSGHMQQASEQSKSFNRRENGSVNPQAAATSSSINKAAKGDDYKAAKGESGNSESLIDFASEAAAPSDSQTNYQVYMSNDGSNYSASSEPSKASSSAPNKSTLEFLLFELAPAVDEQLSGAPSQVQVEVGTQTTAPPPRMQCPSLSLSHGGLSGSTAAGVTSSPVVNPTGLSLLPSAAAATLPQHSSDVVQERSSSAQQTFPSNNSHDVSPFASSTTTPDPSSSNITSTQTSQDRNAACTGGGGGGPHPSAGELKPSASASGRKELPADLFTSMYKSGPAPAPMWHSSPHYGMGMGGYNMQYCPASMQAPPGFQNSAKSTNPFELNDETNLLHSSPFPSLQGALPHFSSPADVSTTTSFGFNSSGAAAYMGQNLYGGMQLQPSRPQGGNDGGIYGLSDSTQHPRAYQYSTPTNPSSFSMGGIGNPFG
ncbi:hypothetical protein Dimus_019319 [Dionaea muscipula]